MFRKMLGLGVVALLGSLLPLQAHATLIVDLRFADGSKSKAAVAGTYAVNVYAQVTGTNASADESLNWLFGSVQSAQLGGGVLLAGTSGVTGNAANSTNSAFTITTPRGQPGTAQNLTADGVADWGTTATNNANTIKYNTDFGDSTGVTFATTANSGAAATSIANGVEFLVGTLTVQLNLADINAIANSNAATAFNWVKGTGTIPTAMKHRVDGVATDVTAASAYLASVAAADGATPNNGVLFTPIPEPASIGLLGLASVGLLSGRRRKA